MIDPDSVLQQLWAVNHANVLLLGGVLFITAGLFNRTKNIVVERMVGGCVCLLVLGLAAALSFKAAPISHDAGAMFVADSVTAYGAKLAIFGGVLLTLLGRDQIRPGRVADHYGCLLLMLSGLIYTSAANDLVSLFLGLELVSIPTTVLLSMSRNDDSAREATLKYFTLAAFSSGIFLLGASYLYGLAGSTALPDIVAKLASESSMFARLAIGLSLCGLCFRVTAVPFHFYAPDVFAGSALHMAASMAFIPKVAGFVAIVRLFGGASLNEGIAPMVVPLVLVIAAVTMTVGNCAALVQTSARRMLAYSSVAHSGYLLLALAALLSHGGEPTIVFDYLVVYAAMTLGFFAVTMVVEQSSTKKSDELAEFNGLYSRNPQLAIGGVICLLSLTGLPLTAGFWAKLQVFLECLSTGRSDVRFVAIVMAINATVAAVYYLSIVQRLFQTSSREYNQARPSFSVGLACGISSIATTLWFFFP
jgi:NADH-quinone oxidoreductase subunit N